LKWINNPAARNWDAPSSSHAPGPVKLLDISGSGEDAIGVGFKEDGSDWVTEGVSGVIGSVDVVGKDGSLLGDVVIGDGISGIGNLAGADGGFFGQGYVDRRTSGIGSFGGGGSLAGIGIVREKIFAQGDLVGEDGGLVGEGLVFDPVTGTLNAVLGNGTLAAVAIVEHVPSAAGDDLVVSSLVSDIVVDL
jgi:hypothetical protein